MYHFVTAPTAPNNVMAEPQRQLETTSGGDHQASHHMRITWKPPSKPNGVITTYQVRYVTTFFLAL